MAKFETKYDSGHTWMKNLKLFDHKSTTPDLNFDLIAQISFRPCAEIIFD